MKRADRLQSKEKIKLIDNNDNNNNNINNKCEQKRQINEADCFYSVCHSLFSLSVLVPRIRGKSQVN